MENNNRGRSTRDPLLKRGLQDMIFILVGLALTFGSGLMLDPNLFMLGFGLGVGLTAVGLCILMYDLFIYAEKLSEGKDLLKDQRGTAVIYAVCIMGIFVTIICWFPLAWAAYEIMDTMTTNFEYPAVAMGTIHLAQWVIAWTPAIIICGLLLYAIISSFRTEYPSGPYR